MTYLEDVAHAATHFTQPFLTERSNDLRAGNIQLQWNRLTQAMQFALVVHNTTPAMMESCRVFARQKPFWMPTPQTLMKTYRCTWNELRQKIQEQHITNCMES